MKNKIALLIFVFTINFSSVYCHDVFSPEPYIEMSNSNFDGKVHNAYRYVSLGVGPVIFIPNVGVGYRERYFQFGWDTALSFSTIGYAHQLSGHVVGHYYLNPLSKNSAYLGLGLMGSGVFTNDKESLGTLSPNFVFGKEFEKSGDSRHFLEMHVNIPSICGSFKGYSFFYFPLTYIKYGIAF